MTRARLWFAILFMPACFGVFAYPLARLTAWLGHPIGTAWTLAVWLVAAAALVYSFRAPNMRTRSVMVHWMGAGFILGVLVFVWELMRWVTGAVTVTVPDRTAAGWILAVAAGIVLWSVAASHRIKVKRLRFVTGKITRRHRIVQLSDVHIGSRRGGFLRRIVAQVNRLQPDLVVITGDLIDSAAVGINEIAALREVHAAEKFFTIGNHERYADPDKAVAMLAELGVKTLRQQSVTAGAAGELQIIGIDDADHPEQVAMQLPKIKYDSQRYCVLLYHRPSGWETAAAHGIDLMLSGHTHNGQIFPFNLVVKQQYPRICGLYQTADANLYVSPGTGTWGPLMRLGSQNEITCIDVVPPAKKPLDSPTYPV